MSLPALQRWHGYLEGLDEGPQQGPDAFPTAQQLHQAHDPEEAEEGDGDAGVLLCTLEPVGNRGGAVNTARRRGRRGSSEKQPLVERRQARVGSAALDS